MLAEASIVRLTHHTRMSNGKIYARGSELTIIRKVNDALRGDMYRARLSDGYETMVFEHEVEVNGGSNDESARISASDSE